MSLSDLARASAVAKGHLSTIEHGLASITIQTISRLAKGLALPPQLGIKKLLCGPVERFALNFSQEKFWFVDRLSAKRST